jgi:hypothetical protein
MVLRGSMNTIMKGYRNILNHRSISSPIQTLLSVPELHRVGPALDAGLADYTAGRELHPAPKKTVVQNSGANIYFLMVNKKIYRKLLGQRLSPALGGINSAKSRRRRDLRLKIKFFLPF